MSPSAYVRQRMFRAAGFSGLNTHQEIVYSCNFDSLMVSHAPSENIPACPRVLTGKCTPSNKTLPNFQAVPFVVKTNFGMVVRNSSLERIWS